LYSIEPTVELLDCTDNPEKNVAIAARNCYSDKTPGELDVQLTKDEIDNLIDKILELQHFSTIEHTHFMFGIECSRIATHQLVRHRIGVSYSQKSERYVHSNNPDMIIPKSIQGNKDAKNIFYHQQYISSNKYEKLIDIGIPKEDARYVLPRIKTDIVVSYNARSLYEFFKQRCCMRAQTEIREIANKMLKIVKNKAPKLFRKAGPKCKDLGYCPENNMQHKSCNKVTKKRALQIINKVKEMEDEKQGTVIFEDREEPSSILKPRVIPEGGK